MVLKPLTRVGKEVNQSTLLHKVIFFVDAYIFHLLLGLLKVLHLSLFTGVSPLASELLSLVESVGIVEIGELWSKHEGEVSDLHVANEPAHQKFVMPDHSTDPFIISPSSHSREGSNGTNIEEQEDKTTSASRKRFVVWRYLFWSNCLEKSLHVVIVREENWVGFGVVWVLVAVGHLRKFAGVVVSSIFLDVLGLGTIVASRVVSYKTLKSA